MKEQLIKDAISLPELIQSTLKQIVESEYQLEEQKERLLQTEIEVDNNSRISLQESGTKVTEKIIENMVQTNITVLDGKKSILELKKEIGYHKAQLEMLKTKKEMITAISRLI